ncbi:MAG: dipeptide epimerase [Pseudomonadota bacterium]
MHALAEIVRFPLAKPFAITGYTFNDTETLRVSLTSEGVIGRGESVGTYYLGETAESMLADFSAVADGLDSGIDRLALQEMMPPGGARNAIDCALWDLECKVAGLAIWQLLNIVPKPLVTVFTLGIGEADEMAQAASEAIAFPHLKIKLSNEKPVERLEAIRQARPDAQLVVDVNQGWSFDELKEYDPYFQGLGVAMIEQPLARGNDEVLETYRSKVPLGADESCLHLEEFEAARRRYQVLNIKLDKCGGLTEGLALVRLAQEAGMALMVGNMMGSSLSMAPSFVIGQHCRFVDIDGPLLLAGDIENGLNYHSAGLVDPPESALWG